MGWILLLILWPIFIYWYYDDEKIPDELPRPVVREEPTQQAAQHPQTESESSAHPESDETSPHR
jgi:hypothetical protein